MQRALFNPLKRTLAAGQAARSMRLMNPKLGQGVRFNSSKSEETGAEAKETGEQAKSNEAASEATSETTNETTSETVETLSPEEVKEIKSKLEQKDKELADMKNHYARAIADFRNLQQTTKQEIQKAKDFALQKFAKDLLESADNFSLALGSIKSDSIKENPELDNLIKGVTMTQNIFEKTLNKHGINKIDPIGEPFDPNQHEAVFEIAHPEKEAGTVFHVQQTGYTLNSRVLRPAKVGLVKGEDN